MEAKMWIIRKGWEVREILNSFSPPNVNLREGEALFEVPPGFEGIVGDDVRMFEEDGTRKPTQVLVRAGLIPPPPRVVRVPRRVIWARRILGFILRRVIG